MILPEFPPLRPGPLQTLERICRPSAGHRWERTGTPLPLVTAQLPVLPTEFMAESHMGLESQEGGQGLARARKQQVHSGRPTAREQSSSTRLLGSRTHVHYWASWNCCPRNGHRVLPMAVSGLGRATEPQRGPVSPAMIKISARRGRWRCGVGSLPRCGGTCRPVAPTQTRERAAGGHRLSPRQTARLGPCGQGPRSAGMGHERLPSGTMEHGPVYRGKHPGDCFPFHVSEAGGRMRGGRRLTRARLRRWPGEGRPGKAGPPRHGGPPCRLTREAHLGRKI